ncbi:MAG: hypothetical protein ACE5HE_13560, partial [Phycisphaerae bacterium]
MKTPLSDRVSDALCYAVAVWTICCNAVVALGGSLRELLVLFLGVCLFAGVLLLSLRRARRVSRGSTREDGPATSLALADAPPAARADLGGPAGRGTPGRAVAILTRVCAVVGGVWALCSYAIDGNVVQLWYGGVAVVALGLPTALIRKRQPGPDEHARNSRVFEGVLWAISIGCLMLTLVCHRPDWDDAFYVNVAVAVSDSPDDSLLAKDTMYGIEGLGLEIPVYRLHSYEIFNGAVAYLTGIP